MSDVDGATVEAAARRVIYVTRAQQAAARLIITRGRRPVTYAVRRIAAATPDR